MCQVRLEVCLTQKHAAHPQPLRKTQEKKKSHHSVWNKPDILQHEDPDHLKYLTQPKKL